MSEFKPTFKFSDRTLLTKLHIAAYDAAYEVYQTLKTKVGTFDGSKAIKPIVNSGFPANVDRKKLANWQKSMKLDGKSDDKDYFSSKDSTYVLTVNFDITTKGKDLDDKEFLKISFGVIQEYLTQFAGKDKAAVVNRNDIVVKKHLESDVKGSAGATSVSDDKKNKPSYVECQITYTISKKKQA